nr:hypothetical protein [Tanacetum cinerariifolium]
MTTLTSMCEMVCQIVQKKQEEKRIEEEQAANAQYYFPEEIFLNPLFEEEIKSMRTDQHHFNAELRNIKKKTKSDQNWTKTGGVKEYQEKDKIGSKPDKNGRRGEAGKSLK